MNTIRILLTFVFALTAVAVAQADYDVVVTGTTSGVVWGSGPYTSDSSIAAASVHAGILVVGQTGTIRVHPVGTLSNFSGSTQNGVTTYSYASPWSAVTLSIAPGNNAPVPTVSAPSSANVSTQFEVIASASDADGNLTSMAVVREDTGLVESWSVSGNSAYNSTHVTAPSAAGVIRVRTEATDAAGVTRASEWAAISIVGGSNLQPSVTLTPSVSSVPPGGSFNATVRAQDPDANLVSLAVSDYISGQQ